MASAERARAGLREVCGRAHVQAAAAEPDELLAELPEVLRQPAEGLVGRCGARRQPLGLSTTCRSSTSMYDMLQVYELMHQGKINGYLAQGFNPLAAAPNKAKMTAALSKLKFLVIMDPLVTETSEFWRNFGVLNDVDPSEDPDGSVSPADDVLRRGRRRARQLRPLAAVALERRASRPARRAPIIEIMAGLFTAPARALRERRRRVPRSDRESRLAVRQRRQSRRRRNSRKSIPARRSPISPIRRIRRKIVRKAGEQLAGFGELRDDGTHGERLLDLLRLLGPDRQSDGAPRQLRSDRHRPDAELGVVVAGEPSHPLQPRLVRSQRQAVQSGAQADRVERQALDRRRHARLQGGRGSRRAAWARSS